VTAAIRNASSIRARGLSVRFDDGTLAIDAADLFVPPGRITCLIGPSGCGKTTLLRTMAGLQPVTGGSVELQPPAASHAGEIAFVFQQPALLPWRTALENVLLPLELAGIGDRLARRRAAERMLETVGLGEAAWRRPDQLSGGMQMRVSIARALVTSPGVLLLDEPFAALDDMLRNQLGGLLRRLWSELGFTAVMVTHNIGEAVLLSHRIAVMRERSVGEPLENPLAEPRDQELRRTAEFANFYGEVSDALRGRR